MAETLVLASLQVDASGVVSGIGTSNRELARGETALNRFGSAGSRMAASTQTVVNRMFSLRQAALAVTRVLGIAGVVLTLTHALVGLGKELVTSTGAFQRASAAVKDWWQQLVHGEDAVGRLSRKLGSSGGPLALLEKMRKLQAEQTGLETFISEGGQEPAQPLLPGVGGFALAGFLKSRQAPDKSLPQALATAAQQLEFVKKEIAETALALQNFGKEGETAATKITTLTKANNDLAQEMERLPDITMHLDENINSAFESLEFWNSTLVQTGSIMDGLTPAMEAQLDLWARMREESTLAAKEVQIAIEAQAAAMQQMVESAQFDILLSSMQQIGQTLSTALVTGSGEGKEALASLMATISQACFAYAAMFAAAAVAASTGFGAGVLAGSPGQFAAAAGKFAAAGVVSGLLARSLGGGGGGGGGGGRETIGSAAAPAGGGGERRITINVQGSLIGTDEDNLARDLAKLLKTAESDGGA